MTDLKTRVEMRIMSQADYYTDVILCAEPINEEHVFDAYKAGANSLAPLLIEMATALTFFKGDPRCYAADEAMQKLEDWLGE